ncbi:NAD(P)-dependent dehydrogenase (short-subunit alcohol dehydrogenase family) [Bradyrhizobium sp. AZCC 2262]
MFPLDVTDADEIAAVTNAILAKYGRIDLLVNSAGLNLPKRSWEDVELQGWDQIVDVNLNGLLYCMRAVLPAMRAQKDGCKSMWPHGPVASSRKRPGLPTTRRNTQFWRSRTHSTWTNVKMVFVHAAFVQPRSRRPS